MAAQEFQFLVGSYKKEYYLWEVAEMWRKVVLTGVVSILRAGSMLQIVIASAISLGFCVMHARCWPFQRADENRLKLGTEVALMLVFLSTAVLRAAYTKQELVDARILQEDDLTEEDRNMPLVLSWFMLVCSVGIPFGILLYGKHGTADEEGADDAHTGGLDASAAQSACELEVSSGDGDGDGELEVSITVQTVAKKKQGKRKQKQPEGSKPKVKSKVGRFVNPLHGSGSDSDSDSDESTTGNTRSQQT